MRFTQDEAKQKREAERHEFLNKENFSDYTNSEAKSVRPGLYVKRFSPQPFGALLRNDSSVRLGLPTLSRLCSAIIESERTQSQAIEAIDRSNREVSEAAAARVDRRRPSEEERHFYVD